MKFTTPKDNLARAVNTVSRLATTRATLPILQNIYLETTKSHLLLKATDLEQTLEVIVPGEVGETGSLTVPARVLQEYLQNTTDKDITLIKNDLTLELRSANHQARIKGISAEDYPSLPKTTNQNELTLPSKTLDQAIGRTLFAAASDETRPILTGLLFRFINRELTIVGTDGYRLAYTKTKLPSSLTGDFILPKRSLQELQRLLPLAEEAELTFGANQAKITIDQTTLTTRVLDGSFPAYEAIIPK